MEGKKCCAWSSIVISIAYRYKNASFKKVSVSSWQSSLQMRIEKETNIQLH